MQKAPAVGGGSQHVGRVMVAPVAATSQHDVCAESTPAVCVICGTPNH